MNQPSNIITGTVRAVLLSALAVALLWQVPSARAETKTTDPVSSSIEATLTADKKFLVQGEETTLAKLPARLKSAGATRATTVRIAVEKNTPEVTMKAIMGKLRSEGYTRIVFTRPRHAESGVTSNTPTLPIRPVKH